jgi:hypothetical protein
MGKSLVIDFCILIDHKVYLSSSHVDIDCLLLRAHI